MPLYKHTDGNLIKVAGGLATSSNCCCGDVGYCCINGDCVDLDASIGLTCAACNEAPGGVCHRSTTVTCATQSDCECSPGSGAAGTGGSYCTGSGMGGTLV